MYKNDFEQYIIKVLSDNPGLANRLKEIFNMWNNLPASFKIIPDHNLNLTALTNYYTDNNKSFSAIKNDKAYLDPNDLVGVLANTLSFEPLKRNEQEVINILNMLYTTLFIICIFYNWSIKFNNTVISTDNIVIDSLCGIETSWPYTITGDLCSSVTNYIKLIKNNKSIGFIKFNAYLKLSDIPTDLSDIKIIIDIPNRARTKLEVPIKDLSISVLKNLNLITSDFFKY